MKVIKEEIENLEMTDNTVVISQPLGAAEKDSEVFDKRFEEATKTPEDAPLFGAEKQPVPDDVEEPKITLEESLFDKPLNEDYNWNNVYEVFTTVSSLYWPDEEKMSQEVEKVYNLHKGESAWDKAWEKWTDSIDESLKESASNEDIREFFKGFIDDSLLNDILSKNESLSENYMGEWETPVKYEDTTKQQLAYFINDAIYNALDSIYHLAASKIPELPEPSEKYIDGTGDTPSTRAITKLVKALVAEYYGESAVSESLQNDTQASFKYIKYDADKGVTINNTNQLNSVEAFAELANEITDFMAQAKEIDDAQKDLEDSRKDPSVEDDELVDKANAVQDLKEDWDEDGDGWNADKVSEVKEICDEVYNLSYELENTVRGVYTRANTYEELGSYVSDLGNRLSLAGEELMQIDEDKEEDMDESVLPVNDLGTLSPQEIARVEGRRDELWDKEDKGTITPGEKIELRKLQDKINRHYAVKKQMMGEQLKEGFYPDEYDEILESDWAQHDFDFDRDTPYKYEFGNAKQAREAVKIARKDGYRDSWSEGKFVYVAGSQKNS